MKDIDYIKKLLSSDYATETTREKPYPPLRDAIDSLNFDYLAGTVEGEVSNGNINRDGKTYLQFHQLEKSILTHRFIAAVSLGKWPPRLCHIDHINHNPSDNRPVNLRITTPRDNAGNRRSALITDLVDVEEIGAAQKARMQERRDKEARKVASKPELTPRRQDYTDAKAKPVTKPLPKVVPNTDRSVLDKFYPSSPAPSGRPLYTGQTAPGNTSGVYYGTTWGSWHWYPDGEEPDPSEYAK
jgi:hypothetical protein